MTIEIHYIQFIHLCTQISKSFPSNIPNTRTRVIALKLPMSVWRPGISSMISLNYLCSVIFCYRVHIWRCIYNICATFGLWHLVNIHHNGTHWWIYLLFDSMFNIPLFIGRHNTVYQRACWLLLKPPKSSILIGECVKIRLVKASIF